MQECAKLGKSFAKNSYKPCLKNFANERTKQTKEQMFRQKSKHFQLNHVFAIFERRKKYSPGWMDGCMDRKAVSSDCSPQSNK